MLAALLTLVPTLQWPSPFAHQDVGHDQSALDTCISAVRTYFPCDTATNYTCSCEHDLWRLACFDNHDWTRASQVDRAIAEADSFENCHAAGSVGVALIQHQNHLQRRQIGSILSSIAGEVTSVLTSADVTIPTAAITSIIGSVVQSIVPPSQTASTTNTAALSSAVDSILSSVIRSNMAATATGSPASTATNPSSNSQSTAPASSTAAASSSKKSGPPLGIIVGAVVGGVVALALIGILIMLILRHRRKKASKSVITDKEASPTLSYRELNPQSSASIPPSTPYVPPNQPASAGGSPFLAEKYRHEEKIAYDMEPQAPSGSEMGTHANTWEIDGRQMPSELEAGPTYIPYRQPPQTTDSPVSPYRPNESFESPFAPYRANPSFDSPISPYRPDADVENQWKRTDLSESTPGNIGVAK